jgi:hypothetical protein
MVRKVNVLPIKYIFLDTYKNFKAPLLTQSNGYYVDSKKVYWVKNFKGNSFFLDDYTDKDVEKYTLFNYFLKYYYKEDFLLDKKIKDKNLEKSGFILDMRKSNERSLEQLFLSHIYDLKDDEVFLDYIRNKTGYGTTIINYIIENNLQEKIENIKYPLISLDFFLKELFLDCNTYEINEKNYSFYNDYKFKKFKMRYISAELDINTNKIINVSKDKILKTIKINKNASLDDILKFSFKLYKFDKKSPKYFFKQLTKCSQKYDFQ